MRMLFRALGLVFATGLSAMHLQASEERPSISDGYSCKVVLSGELNNRGRMARTDFAKLYDGLKFLVDRDTGYMYGPPRNHNENGSPVVIDRGSDEQSFKAITVYRPFSSVEYLMIEEFSNEQNKPFMFVTGSKVITGVCGKISNRRPR